MSMLSTMPMQAVLVNLLPDPSNLCLFGEQFSLSLKVYYNNGCTSFHGSVNTLAQSILQSHLYCYEPFKKGLFCGIHEV